MSLDLAAAYDEHVWHVYGFFAYRLGSRADAEDLTQLTFERALKARDRFDPERAKAGTWLMAIARNLLIDHYRADKSGATDPLGPDGVEEDSLPPTPGPEQDLGLSPELATALVGLHQRERELIALRFGGDLTGPEIAEMTDLTLANVQQILSRALRKLRTELEPVRDSSSSGGEGPGAEDAGERQGEQRRG
jgi:RNA polymerase sigma-70 factor (ECF subfamily)